MNGCAIASTPITLHRMLPGVGHRPRTFGGLAPLAEEGAHNVGAVHLRQAPPRRPRRNRPSVSWDPTIDIYDDTFSFKNTLTDGQAPRSLADADPTLDLTINRRSTLLAQPAQRLPLSTGHATANLDPETKRRRTSIAPQFQDDPTCHLVPPTQPSQASLERTMTIKKEPRRRTIYIPSDDTTIATIHPGAPSRQDAARPRRPRRSDIFLDLAALPEERNRAPITTGGDENTEQRRGPRKSLAVAPRRGPLTTCTRLAQPKATNSDVPGSGGGKENIPLGAQVDFKWSKSCKDDTLDLKFDVPTPSTKLRSSVLSPKRRMSFAPELHSAARSRGTEAQVRAPPVAPRMSLAMLGIDATPAPAPAPAPVSKPKVRASLLPSQVRRPSVLRTSCASILYPQDPKQAPNTLAIPNLAQSNYSSVGVYSVLPEDISKPELYEENWLGHQETAITECINSLFANSGHADPEGGEPALRKNLISLYHDASTSLLHKRVQASLQFGALSISKDTLSQVGRYVDDLQQRQRFMDLWLKTYNLDSLQAAAEVVMGHEIPKPARPAGSPSQRLSPCSPARRRTLDAYLKTFLVRNEDGRRAEASPQTLSFDDASNDDRGSQAWAWRRTVIRSLSLILLLDKGQAAGYFQGCLFQTSSPLKSSSSVVQALGTLLLPSIGNISRVLEHLSYHVSHGQYALEEHSYRINNLATDLRDGVLLTRLVEILLYPPSSLDVLADMTVTLPSGEMLACRPASKMSKESWVLSQHLKYPCISRVQKLYNVQIALSALSGVRGIGDLLNDTKAEDIVDGHRERNVGLLWSLVGRWGLARLLDFNLIEKEIARLNKVWRIRESKVGQSCKVPGDEIEEDDDLPYLDGLEKHTLLLKKWARSVARLRGVTVSNLSTSFADGKAFKAILAEYAICLPTKNEPSPESSVATTLSTTSNTSAAPKKSVSHALRSLGCSRAFISLFKNTASIPSSHTTIPLLAFLASRLLPSSQPHFAALSIQRAWRRSRARLELRKRVWAAVLARECATVVQARERVCGAAVKIQRWWRALEAYWTRPAARSAV